MRRLLPSFTLLSCLLLPSLGQADEPTNNAKINTKIDFPLTGIDGSLTTLAREAGSKATIVAFLSFECPVSNSYVAELSRLAAKHAAEGVNVVGICPTENEAKKLKEQIAEFKITFPLYLDPKQSATSACKASVTPEFFLLDHNQVLRYRGRFDNRFYARVRENANVTQHDLPDALAALSAGKPIVEPVTKAIGCPIQLPTPSADANAKVTYYRDVLPILQAHCIECHRPGAVGPFSLTTYKQAVNWANDIKEFTANRRMPPWKPTAGPGFHNERRLSDKELAVLALWADSGMPEGNPKDAPPSITYKDGWQLGTPDLVLTVDEDFHLGPSGPDNFRVFVLPTKLTEDKYVVAYEIKPGNPKIVHHTLNFFDTSGKGRSLAEAEAKKNKEPNALDHGPGYSVAMGVGFLPTLSTDGKPTFGAIGGWAPGQLPRILPENSGYFLPKGSDILLQVHYHRNGRPEKDRTSIGLYFAKEPKTMKPFQTIVVSMSPLNALTFTVPPGKSNHEAKGTIYAMNDFTIHSVMPHMHLIGKSIKVTMTPPGEATRPLVVIDEWDYNWQETYWFKEPIKVKAGTRFDIEAIYDNSAANPNNPSNPPKTVRFGEQTTNEMLFGFIGATHDTPGVRARFSFIPPAQLQ